jgi:hypothetical protein
MLATFNDYIPHEGQLEYHNSNAETRVIIASIRSGKSYGVLHDCIVTA